MKNTEELVCEDIKARAVKGLAKYGVSVADNPLNLRQWLNHAYEEALDLAIYLRRAMQEMDKPHAVESPDMSELKNAITELLKHE